MNNYDEKENSTGKNVKNVKDFNNQNTAELFNYQSTIINLLLQIIKNNNNYHDNNSYLSTRHSPYDETRNVPDIRALSDCTDSTFPPVLYTVDTTATSKRNNAADNTTSNTTSTSTSATRAASIISYGLRTRKLLQNRLNLLSSCYEKGGFFLCPNVKNILRSTPRIETSVLSPSGTFVLGTVQHVFFLLYFLSLCP